MIEMYRYRNLERMKFSVELWRLGCGCREVQVHLGIFAVRFNWSKCDGW